MRFWSLGRLAVKQRMGTFADRSVEIQKQYGERCVMDKTAEVCVVPGDETVEQVYNIVVDIRVTENMKGLGLSDKRFDRRARAGYVLFAIWRGLSEEKAREFVRETRKAALRNAVSDVMALASELTLKWFPDAFVEA